MQYRTPPLRVELGLCPPASPVSQASRAPVDGCALAPILKSVSRATAKPPRSTSAAGFRPKAPDAADAAVPERLGHHRRESAYILAVRPLFGAILVALLVPPVAAACFAIACAQLLAQRRLDEIFFVQWRAGLRGRPFRILKFRTLRHDGQGNLDPTPLGGLLRKSHLDELPQLWNVVRGDMSLIGPRPETLELEAWADSKIQGFSERLVIRPGITGLAQVVQDSVPQDLEAYREKLRLNEAYLQSMDLLTDLGILVRTGMRPLRPRKFQPGARIKSRVEPRRNHPESDPSRETAFGTSKDLPVGSS